MTFARTWTKVPFMRFDRRMVDRGGTAAATASARALALGLGRMGCHGLPMGKEASTLGNASGECATPNKFSTDPGPRWSQPALTRYRVALLMSESFVHKRIIAGCRCFAGHLPSGPHEEGFHVNP
jgi:hypothetical protein